MNRENDQLSFPSKVFRGPGAIENLGPFCKLHGNRAFILGGRTALSKTQSQIHSSLQQPNLQIIATTWYGGECSRENLNRLKSKVDQLKPDIIIAVGGGKACDTGKALGAECDLPVITVPTLAATCAAITPLSVLYTSQGEFVGNLFLKNCPIGTIIDTSILLDTPPVWLAAGMGDTLAKMYELRAASARFSPNSFTISAVVNGQICYDIISKFGEKALAAIKSQEPGPEFDSVIDAIILSAGLSSIFGGDKLRNAAAHAIYNGFTKIPEAHQIAHGLIVGYGNLCLLALEERSDEEISKEIELAKSCGIPTSLNQIANLSKEEQWIVAEASAKATAMACMPLSVTPEMVICAMQRIDTFQDEKANERVR